MTIFLALQFARSMAPPTAFGTRSQLNSRKALEQQQQVATKEHSPDHSLSSDTSTLRI